METINPTPTRRGFLAHSFEFGFAVLCIIVAASLALLGFVVPAGPATELPRFIGIAWAIALGLGGPAILTGVYWRGSEELSRGFELAGLILCASMWITFVITVFVAAPSEFMSALQGIAMSLGCIGRSIQIARVERAVVRVTQVAKAG